LLTDVINGLLTTKPEWSQGAGIASYFVTVGDYIPNWYRSFVKWFTINKIIYLANEGNILSAEDVIGKLHQPLFIIHGTNDSLIPVRHTYELFKKAREPKLLWIADGCEHAAIWNKYPSEYEEKIVSFLNQYM